MHDYGYALMPLRVVYINGLSFLAKLLVVLVVMFLVSSAHLVSLQRPMFVLMVLLLGRSVILRLRSLILLLV